MKDSLLQTAKWLLVKGGLPSHFSVAVLWSALFAFYLLGCYLMVSSESHLIHQLNDFDSRVVQVRGSSESKSEGGLKTGWVTKARAWWSVAWGLLGGRYLVVCPGGQCWVQSYETPSLIPLESFSQGNCFILNFVFSISKVNCEACWGFAERCLQCSFLTQLQHFQAQEQFSSSGLCCHSSTLCIGVASGLCSILKGKGHVFVSS